MKIVFLKDIPKVGKKYETKNISDGYALNYLIPNGLAQVATPALMKRIDLEKARDAGERKLHEDLLIKNLKDIDGVTITMTEKANEKGHLFAGIHKAEIVPEILKQTHVQIHPDFIDLDKPIKEVGEFSVHVKVQDKKATFKLVVKAK